MELNFRMGLNHDTSAQKSRNSCLPVQGTTGARETPALPPVSPSLHSEERGMARISPLVLAMAHNAPEQMAL